MEYRDGEYGLTSFAFRWGERPELMIRPDDYAARLTPRRSYRICLMGVEDQHEALVCDARGTPIPAAKAYDQERRVLTLSLENVSNQEGCTIQYAHQTCLSANDTLWHCRNILNNAQIDYEAKQKAYDVLCGPHEAAVQLGSLMTLGLPAPLLDALAEHILA